MFDQRGVGYSEPALSCPEILDLTYELLDDDLPTERGACPPGSSPRRLPGRLG